MNVAAPWYQGTAPSHRAALGALLAMAMLLAHTAVRAVEPKVVHVALSEAAPPTSFASNGHPAGMFPELLAALFRHAPGYAAELHSLPWSRAQWAVEHGVMDMFITFPSANRLLYANFSARPLHVLDYGNIVYDRSGPKAARIETATSFRDMRELVFVSQETVAWELENVPAYIERYTVNGPASLMHMTFRRQAGDFFIMNAEQAVYYARQLGYEKQLGMKRVSFIPHSLVALHLGVRKDYPDQKALMRVMASAMKHPEFLAKKAAIIQKYRLAFSAGELPLPDTLP